MLNSNKKYCGIVVGYFCGTSQDFKKNAPSVDFAARTLDNHFKIRSKGDDNNLTGDDIQITVAGSHKFNGCNVGKNFTRPGFFAFGTKSRAKSFVEKLKQDLKNIDGSGLESKNKKLLVPLIGHSRGAISACMAVKLIQQDETLKDRVEIILDLREPVSGNYKWFYNFCKYLPFGWKFLAARQTDNLSECDIISSAHISFTAVQTQFGSALDYLAPFRPVTMHFHSKTNSSFSVLDGTHRAPRMAQKTYEVPLYHTLWKIGLSLSDNALIRKSKEKLRARYGEHSKTGTPTRRMLNDGGKIESSNPDRIYNYQDRMHYNLSNQQFNNSSRQNDDIAHNIILPGGIPDSQRLRCEFGDEFDGMLANNKDIKKIDNFIGGLNTLINSRVKNKDQRKALNAFKMAIEAHKWAVIEFLAKEIKIKQEKKKSLNQSIFHLAELMENQNQFLAMQQIERLRQLTEDINQNGIAENALNNFQKGTEDWYQQAYKKEHGWWAISALVCKKIWQTFKALVATAILVAAVAAVVLVISALIIGSKGIAIPILASIFKALAGSTSSMICTSSVGLVSGPLMVPTVKRYWRELLSSSPERQTSLTLISSIKKAQKCNITVKDSMKKTGNNCNSDNETDNNKDNENQLHFINADCDQESLSEYSL